MKLKQIPGKAVRTLTRDQFWWFLSQESLLTRLPPNSPDYTTLLKEGRRIKQEKAYSYLKLMCAGVPQGSILGAILYVLYTRRIPFLEHETIAMFANDIRAILAVSEIFKLMLI